MKEKKVKEKEKRFFKILGKSLIVGTIVAVVLFVIAIVAQVQIALSAVIPAYEKYVYKHEKSFTEEKTIKPGYISEEKLGEMVGSFWTIFMDLENFYVGLVDMSTGDIVVDNDFKDIAVLARYVNSNIEGSRLSVAYRLGDQQETEFREIMSKGEKVFPVAGYLKDDIIYIEKYCLDSSTEIHSVDLSGVDVSGFTYVKEMDATGYEGRLKIPNHSHYSNDGENDITFMELRVNEENTDQKNVEKALKLLKDHKKANNRIPLDNYIYFTYYFEQGGKQYGSVVTTKLFEPNATDYDDNGVEFNLKDQVIKALLEEVVLIFVTVYIVCVIISAIKYLVRRKRAQNTDIE